MKHVSVVIPTYNGQQLLEKNLPAVLNCLHDGDEVVIVDDASTDQTLSWLKNQFATKSWTYTIHNKKYYTQVGAFTNTNKKIRILVVLNKRNLRFGRSCNRGVLLAKYNLIFLLNNDVSPHRDVLKHLLPYFNDKQVFAVGPLEIERHAGNQKGGKNKIWFEKGLFVHSRADDYQSGETAWVSGGSGLFDKKKWLTLDGFDPSFAPAYWEDIDLSYRARKKGWKVVFEEKAIVDHNHESTNQDVFGNRQIATMSWKNADLFTKKHANFFQKIYYLLWKPYWWIKRLWHE